MKYNTFLFDLDGTLLDSLEDIADALNRTMDHFGLPRRSLTEVRSFVGNGARKLIELSVGENHERLEEILDYYKEDYDRNSMIKTAPYPGILKTLETLKANGFQTGVVSNKPDITVKRLSDAIFQDRVDVAIGEKQGVRRKPAPDTVLAAISILGSSPEQTVYIGDSDVDVITARAAGVRCVSVTWGFRDRDVLENAGAECIVDSCAELLEKLTKT